MYYIFYRWDTDYKEFLYEGCQLGYSRKYSADITQMTEEITAINKMVEEIDILLKS